MEDARKRDQHHVDVHAHVDGSGESGARATTLGNARYAGAPAEGTRGVLRDATNECPLERDRGPHSATGAQRSVRGGALPRITEPGMYGSRWRS